MSQDNTARTGSVIRLEVDLDAAGIPENIRWTSDAASQKPSPAEAFFLSLWDARERQMLRIDLWTKAMKTDEMDLFVFQHLLTLSETYQRANQQSELGEMIRQFGFAFGEKAGLIKAASKPADEAAAESGH